MDRSILEIVWMVWLPCFLITLGMVVWCKSPMAFFMTLEVHCITAIGVLAMLARGWWLLFQKIVGRKL